MHTRGGDAVTTRSGVVNDSLLYSFAILFNFHSLLFSALTVRLEYWLWLNMVLQSCYCCFNKWFHLNAKESLSQRDFTAMISMLNLNSRRARSFQDLLKMHRMLHHGRKKLLLVSFPRMTGSVSWSTATYKWHKCKTCTQTSPLIESQYIALLPLHANRWCDSDR